MRRKKKTFSWVTEDEQADHEAAQRFGPGGISQHVSKNDVSKHGRLGLQDGLRSEVSGKLSRGLGAVAARWHGVHFIVPPHVAL